MRPIAKSRWLELSSLLDEILDLDAPARGERIAALREDDPALADELQALLERQDDIERRKFLEQPAVIEEFQRLDWMEPVRRHERSFVGETVGAYTIERSLGHGGMGSVWLARRADGRFEGRVAIKFVNAAIMARGGAERFEREGSILARLAHPNIARLLDAGVARGGTQPYLVLEYIDGVPITTYCDARALGVQARVRLFLDVLAAVAHAHNRLILHRDLKPSNILVTDAGEVKLLDFGIAKLLDDEAEPAPATEITQLAGHAFTVHYAAPEQLQRGDVTTATDVYALGVLLYVLLGGVHPTAGSTTTPLDQMRAVVETEPRRLSDSVMRHADDRPAARRLARELRGDLDNIVARALKKQPSERYANAALLADDLRRYLNHEPVTARADSVGYRVGKFIRRHGLGLAAGTIAALALATGAAIAMLEAREARHQRAQAEKLIEFMLGDLRKKLEPVGRLEALDAVGDRALAYYAAQEAGRLDADSLGRQSRALHLIGEIAEQRGSLDEAMTVFRRAADSTGLLMARYPNDGQRIFDHAQSVYWVGYIARRRGQVAEAESSFGRYLELAQRLVRLDPQKLDWRIERAYAGQNLGVLYLESSRAAQALEAFSDTRDAWSGIVQARPELGVDLANTWGWIAKAQEALGRYEEAIAAQHAKRDLLGRMPGATTDRRVQYLLANASYETGRLQLISGRPALASQAARDALDRFDTLVALDAANSDWLAQTTFARLSLAEIQQASGQHEAAAVAVRRAANDTRRLLQTDSTRAKWNITLSGALLLRQLALPDAAGLVPELQAFIARVGQAESAASLDADQAQIASAAQIALGDILARGHGAAQARGHWEQAARRLAARAAAGEPGALTLAAHARLRLGAAEEARAMAQRVERSHYRHPAYADLQQRLKAAAGSASVQ